METSVAVVNEVSSPCSVEELELKEPRADEVMMRVVATGSVPKLVLCMERARLSPRGR